MSLADGEYEIDLSSLLDLPSSTDDNNIAIRYGFIPDSMDQSKPVKLHQNKDEYILETTDSDNKSILFEGIPQSRAGATNDSYYLTHTPDNTVQLKKLTTTIRFNKSRNVNKLNTKINQWQKQVASQSKPSIKKSTSATIVDKPTTPKTASKRPPVVSTPNRKSHHNDEPIISESDFDDLNESDGDDHGFPVIIIDDMKKKVILEDPVTSPKETNLVEPKKPIKKDIKLEPSEKSIDLDDDFKDLEDQLQEVLEEEEPKQTKGDSSIKFDDSDESDVDDFRFTGIKIDEGNSQPKKNAPVFNNRTSGNSKPMSLRDLVGGESKTRDADLSSSEEE
ncbi:hypothetical protein JA1_001542 [Spathaspora sp. JA1]|nr:hypothetical protein JA1_001542 [Spathaspora sp. JA1]